MLKVVRQIENKLEELFEQYCRISSALMKCTSRTDILGGGGYSDRISFLTARKIELEGEIAELITIQAKVKAELASEIVEAIDEQAVRDVIYLRYGGLRRFEEIAAILKISLRKVFRLHKVGLQTITDLHDKSMQKNYT